MNFSLEERMEYLRNHGWFSMAYSTLQEGLEYFDLEGIGYIAYKIVKDDVLALANPVSSDENTELIVSEFLERFPKASFIQIQRKAVKVLKEKGFKVNCMGIETFLDMSDYDIKGDKKKLLRKACNKIEKEDIRFEELTFDGLAAYNTDLRELSEEWMAGKKVSDEELRFLARPAVYEDETDVRKFYEIRDSKIVGFAFCDPLYKNEKVFGYNVNILRFSKDATKGSVYALVLYCGNKFKEEGNPTVSLGLSPLYRIGDYENDGWVTKKFLQKIFDKNELYNYQGLAETKRQFRGMERPVYFATRAWIPLRIVKRTMEATGLFD